LNKRQSRGGCRSYVAQEPCAPESALLATGHLVAMKSPPNKFEGATRPRMFTILRIGLSYAQQAARHRNYSLPGTEYLLCPTIHVGLIQPRVRLQATLTYNYCQADNKPDILVFLWNPCRFLSRLLRVRNADLLVEDIEKNKGLKRFLQSTKNHQWAGRFTRAVQRIVKVPIVPPANQFKIGAVLDKKKKLLGKHGAVFLYHL